MTEPFPFLATIVAKEPRPMPVLMPDGDIVGMKQAEDLANRNRRTIQRWCRELSIGHQTAPNAPWEISAPALIMVRHGDVVALELLRAGRRDHERVKRVLEFLGIQ